MRNVSIFVFIFFLSLSPKCNSNHLNSTGNIISFNVWLYNHIVIIRPLVSFLWCLTVHTCRRSLPMRHHPHSRSTSAHVCVSIIYCAGTPACGITFAYKISHHHHQPDVKRWREGMTYSRQLVHILLRVILYFYNRIDFAELLYVVYRIYTK